MCLEYHMFKIIVKEYVSLVRLGNRAKDIEGMPFL